MFGERKRQMKRCGQFWCTVDDGGEHTAGGKCKTMESESACCVVDGKVYHFLHLASGRAVTAHRC